MSWLLIWNLFAALGVLSKYLFYLFYLLFSLDIFFIYISYLKTKSLITKCLVSLVTFLYSFVTSYNLDCTENDFTTINYALFGSFHRSTELGRWNLNFLNHFISSINFFRKTNWNT